MKYSPIKEQTSDSQPWEGDSQKKPWEYKVTAVIPVLDTPEELVLVVRLLELQTEKPFIQIIDTGSTPENWLKIEALRKEGVEVHQLRFEGVIHPSDFPAIAMDFAFSACRTPYLFATHADCFLRRSDVLAELLALCDYETPIIGYEITERSHEDWVGMVSHTCSIYHMGRMDEIGAGWSLRRLCRMFGIADSRPNPLRPNWPDTELLINYIARANGIVPKVIGTERNFERTLDDRIDHCRTLTAGKLYSPEYFQKASAWADEARQDAAQRIKSWTLGNLFKKFF